MNINRTTLPNGLRVVHCPLSTTRMVAVNVLYRVGSANEVPEQTGFAHLFEHLMFGGTVRYPDYDAVLQQAQGDNNAYTTWDYTDYYVTLPATNLSLALDLELDRMAGLAFTLRSLEVQRKVVMEEFKQTYLNQPYGDVQHLIARLAFGTADREEDFPLLADGLREVNDIRTLCCEHSYSWPTIGLELSHIADATMPQVKDFFHRFYRPDNAILVVTGDVTWNHLLTLLGGTQEAPAHPQTPSDRLDRCHKGGRRCSYVSPQTEGEGGQPPLLVMAFYLPPRSDVDFQACDMLSDVLSNGKSSRFNRRLVEQQQLFVSLDAYVDGRLGTGLLMIEGIPSEGVSLSDAEEAVWQELRRLHDELVSDTELQRVKNKYATNAAFQLSDYQRLAEQLAYFEMLGDARLLQSDVAEYQAVTAEQLRDTARRILTPSHASVLHYSFEVTPDFR